MSMEGQPVVMDVQPPDAAFAGISRESTEAIKAWVMGEINTRMVTASRVVEFVDDMDKKRKELEDFTNGQVIRVTKLVDDINKTKDDVRATFATIEQKILTGDKQLEAVPEITRQIDDLLKQTAEAFKKTEDMLKANETRIEETPQRGNHN